MTVQHPDETAAAEAAIDAAAAEAAANEPGALAQTAEPAQPMYALYPVEWQGDEQKVTVEPSAPLTLSQVWHVLRFLARRARAEAPDPVEADRRVAIATDLALHGHAFVNAATGDRVPPRDAAVRMRPDGSADAFLIADPEGREELRVKLLTAMMPADTPAELMETLLRPSTTTYENAADWQSATWEWMTGPDGPVTSALAEITEDLRATGVLADGESVTI